MRISRTITYLFFTMIIKHNGHENDRKKLEGRVEVLENFFYDDCSLFMYEKFQLEETYCGKDFISHLKNDFEWLHMLKNHISNENRLYLKNEIKFLTFDKNKRNENESLTSQHIHVCQDLVNTVHKPIFFQHELVEINSDKNPLETNEANLQSSLQTYSSYDSCSKYKISLFCMKKKLEKKFLNSNKYFLYLRINQISYFKNDCFELNSFFKMLIKSFDKDSNEVISLIKDQQSKNFPTFDNKSFLRDSKKFFIDIFSIDIIEIIRIVEANFLIRFFSICKITNDINRNDLKNMFTRKERNTNFQTFYDTFIRNKLIIEYFNRETPAVSSIFFVAMMDICSFIFEFRNLLVNYLSKVSVIISNRYFTYAHFRGIFDNQTITFISKTFVFWFYDLFRNDTNKILLLIFPELIIFIENAKSIYEIDSRWKKFHFLISLVIFKYSFMLPLIKKEFLFNLHDDNFKITDSKLFNTFVFEMRCLFCIYGTELIFTDNQFKIIYFKTFLSFIRLKNPNHFRFLVLNDYSNINDCKIIGCLAEFSSLKKPDIRSITRTKQEFLAKFAIEKVQNYIFSAKYLEYTELEKLEKLYVLMENNCVEKNLFFKKHVDLEKKLTEIFKELFNH